MLSWSDISTTAVTLTSTAPLVSLKKTLPMMCTASIGPLAALTSTASLVSLTKTLPTMSTASVGYLAALT
jgi:phosphohistidine swiveling domain-containing protein